MKKKNASYVYLLTILFSACFLFSSCTKSSNDLAKKVASKPIEEFASVDDSDLNETAEDLLSVDYKQFYDDLSPHGQWVQVNAKDLGIDMSKLKNSAALQDFRKRNSFLYELAGINTAYADADVDFGMFFVWQPSPDLAVTVAATNDEDAPVGYVPYTNGQWENTDDGWYFAAATPYEDVTCHYGRWAYTDDAGWVWAPGRVWAPSWVEWRDDDDYVAWAPMGPGSCIVDAVIYDPFPIVEDRYYICDKRYFCEPDCYRHIWWDREHRDHIREMGGISGINVVNHTVVNRGPAVTSIETKAGRHFDPVNINRVNNVNDVKVTNNQINTYSQRFVKDNKIQGRNMPVSEPKSYKEFANVKSSKNNIVAHNPNEKETNTKPEVTQKENVKGDNNSKGNNNGAENNSKIQKFKNKGYNQNQGNKVNKNNLSGRNKTYGQKQNKKTYSRQNNTGHMKSKPNGQNKYTPPPNNNNGYKKQDRNNNNTGTERQNGNYNKGNTNKDNTNRGNTNRGNTNKPNNNDKRKK